MGINSARRLFWASFPSLLVSVSINAAAQETAERNVTPQQAASGKYRAHQEFLKRIVPRSSVNGQSDSLSNYTAKCAADTGIQLPQFSCSSGQEVPGQEMGQDGNCNYPNVLNHQCDPGSRFQVLPGRTDDAVAVAHCRRVGLPSNGSTYNDIAIIQYNKSNGALCFYQALTNLPGDNIPTPSDDAKWGDGNVHWKTPAETEAIGCTGCHDNGGFIRSEYLAQLERIPGIAANHILPNTSQGFDNLDAPVRYVGRDYATNRSWSITASPAAGDQGEACNSCHRIAVPNSLAFHHSINGGTGALFADIATAKAQDHKNAHSPSSPIWMRRDQTIYDEATHLSALNYKKCALEFFKSNFTTPPPGCAFEPLGEPLMAGWEELNGTFTGAPRAVSWGANHWDFFGIGSDKSLYHQSWTGKTFFPPFGSTWENLGGNFRGQPAAVTRGSNRLDVFAIGTDGVLYRKAWTGLAWQPSKDWEPMGGKLEGNPVAVSWGPNRFDVFALSTDLTLLHKAWTGTAWQPSLTGWESLGGRFLTTPSVVSWGPNRIDIFGLSPGKNIVHKAWTGTAWYPSAKEWESMGGDFTGNPAVVSWGPNRLDLFAIGDTPERSLSHKAWTGNAWFPSQKEWEGLGGSFHKDQAPIAVSQAPNRIDIFGVGQDARMYHKAWTGDAWSPALGGWEGLGGMFSALQPAAVSWGPNRIDLFDFGADHHAYHRAWNGTAWNPPQ